LKPRLLGPRLPGDSRSPFSASHVLPSVSPLARWNSFVPLEDNPGTNILDVEPEFERPGGGRPLFGLFFLFFSSGGTTPANNHLGDAGQWFPCDDCCKTRLPIAQLAEISKKTATRGSPDFWMNLNVLIPFNNTRCCFSRCKNTGNASSLIAISGAVFFLSPTTCNAFPSRSSLPPSPSSGGGRQHHCFLDRTISPCPSIHMPLTQFLN